MNLVQQGLIGWIAAPQGEALNALLVELDLAAHQAVCPLWIDGNAMAEQPDMTVIIGAPEMDETAGQWDIKGYTGKVYQLRETDVFGKWRCATCAPRPASLLAWIQPVLEI